MQIFIITLENTKLTTTLLPVDPIDFLRQPYLSIFLFQQLVLNIDLPIGLILAIGEELVHMEVDDHCFIVYIVSYIPGLEGVEV